MINIWWWAPMRFHMPLIARLAFIALGYPKDESKFELVMRFILIEEGPGGRIWKSLHSKLDRWKREHFVLGSQGQRLGFHFSWKSKLCLRLSQSLQKSRNEIRLDRKYWISNVHVSMMHNIQEIYLKQFPFHQN